MSGRGYVCRSERTPLQWNRHNHSCSWILPKRMLRKLLEPGIVIGEESRFSVTATLTLDKGGQPTITLSRFERHAPHYRKSRQGRRFAVIPQGYAPITG